VLTLKKWEKNKLGVVNIDTSQYTFPEPDLLAVLVDSYFSEANTLLGLLHRPTFDRSVQTGLHLRDSGFARVLLSVCAVACLFVDDPCVFTDGSSTQSAGWKYFSQTQTARMPLLVPPSLYDLQLCCVSTYSSLNVSGISITFQLSIMFIKGSSAPQASWSIIGVGIRMAQEVGAHRRRVYDNAPCAYNELWKRAFW
jgi:hypothetical protein